MRRGAAVAAIVGVALAGCSDDGGAGRGTGERDFAAAIAADADLASQTSALLRGTAPRSDAELIAAVGDRIVARVGDINTLSATDFKERYGHDVGDEAIVLATWLGHLHRGYGDGESSADIVELHHRLASTWGDPTIDRPGEAGGAVLVNSIAEQIAGQLPSSDSGPNALADFRFTYGVLASD